MIIDNTSHFRMDPDVPLVVPEVNPEAIAQYTKRRIIANPNCSTIQLLVALKPLHDLAKIRRVVVATYQSVSGAGREAMDELFTQTRAIFVNDAISSKEQFTKQIAFNVIPQIDVFMEDGQTKEEWKMTAETKKILDPRIKLAGDLRAGAGVHRPCGGRYCRIRKPDQRRRGARGAAPGPRHQRWSITGTRMASLPPPKSRARTTVFVSRIREDISGRKRLVLLVRQPTMCARARR